MIATGCRGIVITAMAVVFLGESLTTMPAHASPTACRKTIVEATAKLTGVRTSALAKCWTGVIAGKLPGPCPDVRATTAIGKAKTALAATIAKACGGADKVCGAGTAPDEPLAAIGWDIGTCASVGDGVCTNPIADCNGIAACVTCVSEQRIDQAFDLYVNAVPPPGDKGLRTCLGTIVKSNAAGLLKMTKALAKCWVAVNKSGTGGSFSCPDASAAGVLAKSRAATGNQICDACKGGNRTCGDGDDVPLASTGFVADCPAVGACSGPVQTVRDLAGCASCVTGVLVDSAVRSTIPAYTSSVPPQCVVAR